MPADAHLRTEAMTRMAAADVERYVKMRARLVAASEALARATSAESAAAAAGSALVSLTGAQHAAVLFRSTNGVVTCPWYYHLSEGYVRELITPEGENPWIHLVRHPELACMDLPRGGRKRAPAPWLLPDVCELPIRYAVRQRVQQEGMRSICSWPLTRAGRTIGALAYYYDTPHISSETEQEILRVFASQAAMAIEHGITARAPKWTPESAEASVQSPVRLRAGLKVEAIRLAETLRGQDLAVKRPMLTEGAAPLQAEHQRLADAQAALAAQNERLADVQRALRSEAEQLTQARQTLNADAARVAALQADLTAEGARLAEAREHVNAERTQVADLQAKLDTAETTLDRDRKSLETEEARISAARRDLEAAQAQVREHDTAQAGLAISEQRRLADARRAVEEEQVRLVALQHDCEKRETRLAQERAALSAERARLAAAKASYTVETERLAQAQRQLQDERAQLSETHKAREDEQLRLAAERTSLQAEHRRLADAQAALAAENGRLADAQRALRSEAEQLTQARQTLNADAARVAALQADLTAEGARLAEAREHVNAERTQVADLQAKLDTAETTLDHDRKSLETEEARISAARRDLEAARAQVREADTAQAGLAISEQRRLADARRAVEEERARLAAAQASHTMEIERLTQAQRQLQDERAQLSETHKVENERLADAQRALRREVDQLTQARQTLNADAARVAALQAELTAEGARLAEAREHLNAERTQLADLQAKLDTAETVLDGDRKSLETVETRISAARRELEIPQIPAVEAGIEREQQRRSSRPSVPAPKAGEATYRTLVQRIGAPAVEDDDRQIAMVADLLDARNGYAEGYSKCLVGWVETLAREFSCSEPDVQAVRRAALLQGIGTIDVPESTLRKSSDATADEQAMIREQPVVAFRVLNSIEWLRPAAAILRRRFERWDGTGHPDRLKENAIPLGARMLAVVEAYGTMVMGRPGAPTLSSLDAIAGLKHGAGRQFDPAIVGAFCQIVTRARVGRVAAHDGVVALLKNMARMPVDSRR